MFDIGWSEMALVLLVALIVIGPKDLPRVARTVGQWVGKGRAMAREFQRALEDMAREAELDKVKSEIEKAGRTDIGKTIEKTIDPAGELSKAFDPRADGKTADPRADGKTADPKADSKAADAGKPTSGERPASTKAQGARPPAAPVKPETHAPAVNGGGVAAEPEAPAARKSTRAAPAKRKRRAAAGNGADAADDTKKPAPETAPAEPN